MDIKKNNNINDSKSKSKNFWKNVGFIGIAFAIAIVTLLVLNLN